MSKILGIDLGTNSLGLTLREDDIFSWYGVYIFRKGVGEGKSGEFSLAAERTKHRSSRRLYNARRYRKWETLSVLAKFGFCPLSEDNLKKWRNYQKGAGRVFPVNDADFDRWIKLDFDGDTKPDFSSPYQLRRFLIQEKLDLSQKEDRYKIGRALYHIAQRRGFKSSRKNGANEKTAVYKGSSETKTIGRNDYENLIEENGSLGAAFAHLEDQNIRIRNRYTLRSDYQNEVHKILEFQKVSDNDFIEKVDKAIFFQRPLRSQKGLVGKCTLEPNKSRCPVSHPKFEEYRTWSFINNIKYRTEKNHQFQPLPIELKEKLYNEEFFFKSKRELKFSDIRKFIQLNGGKDWELNYNHRMDEISVPSCYVSARLKATFGEDWESFEKKVTRKNKKGEDETKTYAIEDIWHILFSFEDEEYFTEFLENVLELNDEQIKELSILFNNFPVGYANLGLKAINNILPFLKEGLIYSEAVILAKIPEIIGKEIFVANKSSILNAIESEIEENRFQKTVMSIVNNLIFKYYARGVDEKYPWKAVDYKIDEYDYKEIEKTAIEHYGEKTWSKLEADFKQRILDDVAKLYQDFFASSKREHFKPPHLVNQIKIFLGDKFHVSAKLLDKIYHPSQIDIYPSKEGQEFLESPKTAAFKNPMAYKTLYKLRSVINYLIEIGKIDNETRIVVEIARDLNDSNKRWAIEKYQRDREVENLSFAAAIEELLKDSNFSGYANPKNENDIDKFRIWTEQLENFDEIRTEINAIENNKKISASEKDIMKYRLWKEQNCFCMYTGKPIKLTDLFNKNIIDFEHTIPRSKSFDNSLANLTVCYADYNRNIKKNKLPSEMPNYEEDANGYSAIKPRLLAWEKKVEALQNQIETQKRNSKFAIDKETKDKAIRLKHVLQMEYDYWKNKVDRFTRTEIPKGFINSQLTDTQIITKYAFHYLKTVFNKVDVIKGSQTAEFRKIYSIQPKGEIKNRDKHSHHAVDAAVLTLIPSARNREEILKKSYEFAEQNNNKQYHEKPFPDFSYSMIEEIERDILINNIVDKDQTLTPVIKKVRKRGRVVWLRDKEGKLLLDENGNKIPKIAQGDSVRGELHKQTYYGKIKRALKNENGSLIRDENGNITYNQVDGKDEVWMVIRKPIDSVNFKTDVIIDENIANYLKNQLDNGIKQTELKDFQGNFIRHLRCRVKAARGFMNPDNATIVKEQTYKSKKEYKNYIYADSGENYMFGLYENENGKSIVSFNVLESAQYGKHLEKLTHENLFKSKEPILIGRGKKAKEAILKHVFMLGQKVLLFENEKEELKDLEKNDLSKRLYFVKRLADANAQRILFQHHLEARDDQQLSLDFPKEVFGTKGKDGFSKFSTDFVAPRLLLTPGNFSFIIEGKDFEMKLDGSIEFHF